MFKVQWIFNDDFIIKVLLSFADYQSAFGIVTGNSLVQPF